MRKLSILLAFFTIALFAQEAPKPQEAVKPAEAAKPQETKPQPPPPPVVKEVIFDQNVPKEADSIRICSFNIRTRGDKAPNDWQTRISRIHAILEKYELDSIGVQELTTQQKNALTGVASGFAVGTGVDGTGGCVIAGVAVAALSAGRAATSALTQPEAVRRRTEYLPAAAV